MLSVNNLDYRIYPCISRTFLILNVVQKLERGQYTGIQNYQNFPEKYDFLQIIHVRINSFVTIVGFRS